MISILKKDSVNIGILDCDFEIYKKILSTLDIPQKDTYFNELNNYITPSLFKDKFIIVSLVNEVLSGYVIATLNNSNEHFVEIDKLFINSGFEKKGIDELILEVLIYVSNEIQIRDIVANVSKNDYNLYRSIGFYDNISTIGQTKMRLNVSTCVTSRNLIEKIRKLPSDYVNYDSIKIIKKISSSKSSNIYLTDDGRILKMFTTNSFIEIKEKEETLNRLKKIDIKEILKPKNLVYYNGIFVGYIMDYLPNGNSLWDLKEQHNFESKIEKIKELEKVIKILHSKGIYLSYVDLSNIFYDEKGNLKIIDCDSFIFNTKELGENIPLKYKDPTGKIINEKTDLYAFSVACLELLTNLRIPNNTSHEEVEKIYLKNKNKLPVSFKNYFEKIFKENERCYLSDSYEKYLNEIFNVPDESDDVKSGNISVIILSIMMVVVTVIGYIVFRIMR